MTPRHRILPLMIRLFFGAFLGLIVADAVGLLIIGLIMLAQANPNSWMIAVPTTNLPVAILPIP